MIRHLLDTCTCVDLIRGRTGLIVSRLRECDAGSVGISSITLAELQYGVQRSSDPAGNAVALAHFVAPLKVMPFDGHAAAAYGPVRATLDKLGTPIGPLDTLIAAHCLALSVTLVTGNEKEFTRVPGLRVVNWAQKA